METALTFRTLLLDRGYAPLKVISWQRAVTLLSLGKVEVLESYDQELRSTTWVIKVPAVARLLNVFKRNKRAVKFSRINICGRDKYTCQYCGKKKNISELTYDHVIPRNQGGMTKWDNIVSSCAACNLKKGGRTPEQAGMKLLNKPVQPERVPSVTIRVSKKNCPDAWRDYIFWAGELEHD